MFKNIKNKKLYNLLQIDIKIFYRSTKKTFLNENIEFANKHVRITRKDVEVIFHSQKSVLYNYQKPWVKRAGIESDHPPFLTKQLPPPIEKSLPQLTPSTDVFYDRTRYYEQHLVKN